MSTTQTAPGAVTSTTRAAKLILEHADRIGLPAPFTITVADGAVSFGFDTLADLTDWALWMETQIDEHTLPSGQVQHRAEGVALEQPLTVWHITAKSAGYAPNRRRVPGQPRSAR
jgi:hypothetical protein